MKNKIMLFLLALCVNESVGQDGSIDSTFNALDNGFFGDNTGANGIVYSTLLQPDGKIVIAGLFDSYNGTTIKNIARLNTNGSLDTTFSSGTGPSGWGTGAIYTISIQLDGKLIIGGDFTSYNGLSRNNVARLNSNGSIDINFNPGLGTSGSVLCSIVQPDGKIIIGGGFTSYNTTAINYVARLNIDGSLDLTFNPSTNINGSVSAIATQTDGKIIIGGGFTSYGFTPTYNIARLNSDGTRDGTFNSGTSLNGNVKSIALQNDGKIIIGGSFTSYSLTPIKYIGRLKEDGSLDGSFATATNVNNTVSAISVQSDGKIVIGGSFTSYGSIIVNHITRLDIDGSLDLFFNAGTSANQNVYCISVQANQKIVFGGNFSMYDIYSRGSIARINSDGVIDRMFNPRTGPSGGTGPNGLIWTISPKLDGKIIIGGDFAFYNDTIKNNLACLNKNGSLDSFFNAFGTGTNNTIFSSTILTDGKILIAGAFTSYNGVSTNRIARLNSDGSLDISFNPGTGANGLIWTTAVQPDGKIIIGGSFTSYNGTSINRLARLNVDGSLDVSFVTGTGPDGPVYCSAIQADGKILLGGQFSLYNYWGQSNCHNILRVNSNGSIDNAFSQGFGANSNVLSIVAQSDGKILLGGLFSSYNGTNRSCIARVNSDGSIDQSFNIGDGSIFSISSIVPQTDGKYIIGGQFHHLNGTPINNLARIDSNGNLDFSFNTGSGTNGSVYCSAIQADGKILIGGSFNRYHNAFRHNIVRLENCANSTVNILSPSNTTVCEGQSISLTASGASIYLWSTNETSAIITVSPSSNTTYSVVGTDSNGCVDHANITVTVNPLPTVSISAPTIVCSGDRTLLSVSGATSYLWNTNETSRNIAVFPTTNTTYTVIGTDSNGCVDHASITVTVNPLPTVSIYAPTSVCSGDRTLLSASGTTSYLWNNGRTSSSILVNPSETSFSYSVVGSNGNSCSDTAYISITVNSNPTITITGNNTICDGASTLLSAGGGNSYLWTTTETTNSITVSPSYNPLYLSYLYYVTGFGINGCSKVSGAMVYVISLPTINVTGDGTICYGENTLLTVNGATTYLWSTNETTTSIMVSPTANTAYTVSGTNSNGCTNDTTVSVLVNSLPTVNINGTNSICSGGLTTLSASGANSYMWFDGSTLENLIVSTIGNYWVEGVDNNGCSNRDTVDIALSNCVWPGDANNDLVANNYDLLPIGLHYNETGIARDSTSNLWMAHNAPVWGNLQSNGLDVKFADCNGDGSINSQDTLAIKLNFGLTHNKKERIFKTNTPDPDLYFVTTNTLVAAGENMTAELWLGRSDEPVNTIYGLAFDVNYNASVVQANSVKISLDSSFLGNVPTNLIKTALVNEPSAKIYAALSRINHNNVSGFGKLATLTMKASIAVNPSTDLALSISNYLALNALGEEIILDAPITSVSSFSVNRTNFLRVYPNPTNGVFVMEAINFSANSQLKVFNLYGEEVYQQKMIANVTTVDLSNFSKGVYFVKVLDAIGRIGVERIDVQ